MSLITKSAVRRRAREATNRSFSANNAQQILGEMVRKQASVQTHDIFLSHSFQDRELILGTALILEDLGFTVYLDWRDDPTLDRNTVTKETAIRLRERMKKSKCLLYATTDNSSSSKWMPWELGFKDGESGKAAILPLQDNRPDHFKGQEYLGIYPYVTQQINTINQEKLWVRWSSTCYVIFDDWLSGAQPYER